MLQKAKSLFLDTEILTGLFVVALLGLLCQRYPTLQLVGVEVEYINGDEDGLYHVLHNAGMAFQAKNTMVTVLLVQFVMLCAMEKWVPQLN